MRYQQPKFDEEIVRFIIKIDGGALWKISKFAKNF